jgi:arsenate reductase-like glutaredoxin family protein
LQEQGVEHEERQLDREPLSEKELDQLIGDRDYRLFLNHKNELYRERNMRENPPPREEALRLMAAAPNLIRRPIVVRGNRFVLGFDEEQLKELLR